MGGLPATAFEIAAAIRTRKLSSAEATRAALDSIKKHDPKFKAFLQVFDEGAMRQAQDVDARLGRGEKLGPLAGVPVALKDNMCLSWGKTTCASRILENYESPYDSTVAKKLMAAGAVIVGKTNLDEFAMGSSTEHSYFGPTRNPWDTQRVPGGSSGGSAAAVAARFVSIALGSDTGGSIRQPAGLCGIVGVKPTYGRVSRYGLVAFASSLDQIGPFTNNVTDAALAMNTICGHDPHDSTSAEHEVPDFASELDRPIDNLRLGVPKQAFSDANHKGVAHALDQTIAVYKHLGAEIVEIDLPLTDFGIAAYYIVAPAEAASNLSRFDGIRYGYRAKLAPGENLNDLYCKSRGEGFGAEVQRRIMLGTHVLSSGYYDAYYNTALKVRRKIKGDYDVAFRAGCHAILMPSSPGPAFKLGEKAGDPLAMYLEDVYTVGVNLAGLPGITFPAGFTNEGGKELPVGMQLIGQPFDEATLLRVARQFEMNSDWHARAPGL